MAIKLTLSDIRQAANRLQGHIKQTPLLTSDRLDRWLGHEVFFKAENLQVVKAFKARGAYNTLAWLHEGDAAPKRIVAYSSGNHAQGVAWAARQFEVPATIYMPRDVSRVKLEGTQKWGACVVLCDSRQQSEQRAAEASQDGGSYLIPSFDHDQVIAGQGTVMLEAASQHENMDAVFVPCGGGGLLSGTLIAARGLKLNTKVMGVEPSVSGKISRSLATETLVRLTEPPATLADGVKTLGASERTFAYLKQLDGLFEVDEADIARWTQWLTTLLESVIEPTAAMSMAAVENWLSAQTTKQKILVILSGGNIDEATKSAVWEQPVNLPAEI